MSCIGKSSLENYVCHANEVIELKLIHNVDDIDDEVLAFSPDYSHQLFGDSENIFGYRNLKVRIYYSACKLNLFMSMSYSDKINSPTMQADDVLNIIRNKLDIKEFTSNIDHFSAKLSQETNFRPFGELIHSFKIDDENAKMDKVFDIYHTNIEKSPGFGTYHDRMQTFLLWYIDGASYIDIDDYRWEYFTIYQKVDGCHAFVGYATVYRYYAYPANIRPRISQVLILPPYQRRGIGVNLLQTIYRYYAALPKVVDITVEDPSDSFSQLRNYVDCLMCKDLPTFSRDQLMKGWTVEMAEEACKQFKLNKRQTRKVYEILKLRTINVLNRDEYKGYRIEVKRRLSAPLLRNRKSSKALPGRTAPGMPTNEMMQEELTAVYNYLEKEYQQTVDRLNKN